MGVAYIRCVGGRSWALPTPTFGSFKNVPDGKEVEDHDLTAKAYVMVELEIFKISKKIWIDLLTFGERSAIIGATNAFEQEQVDQSGLRQRVAGWCEAMGRLWLNTSCEQCTERAFSVGCNGSSRNRTGVLIDTLKGRCREVSVN